MSNAEELLAGDHTLLLVDDDKAFLTRLERAMEKAETIGRNAPVAVRVTKQVARRGRDMGLYAALEYERIAFRRVMLSDDAVEGIASFVEKRAPKYTGR